MPNYTADQIALRDLLEAEKAKTLAWVAEDPQNRWATYAVVDLDHWAEQGITSVAQYERRNTEMFIWDVYKDVHGIRPRFLNMSEMSDEELNEFADRLANEAEEEAKREAAREEKAVEKFEAKIAELIEIGAGDRETALRWLREGDDEQYQYDNGYFEFCNGLPYGYLKKEAA